jgi:hypothetical protein
LAAKPIHHHAEHMNKRSITGRVKAFLSGTENGHDVQDKEDAGTPINEEDFTWPPDEEGMDKLYTHEESEPLLAMLERYRWLPSASHRNAIVEELLTGEAILYVMVFRKTSLPAPMLVADGPANGFIALTTIPIGLDADPGPEYEVMFRSFTAPETMRLLKKGKFDFLYLNMDLPTAAMVVRYKNKWGVRGPLLPEDEDGGEQSA